MKKIVVLAFLILLSLTACSSPTSTPAPTILPPTLAPTAEPTETGSVTISFVNTSNQPLHLFWVDFDGNEQSYGVVSPSEPVSIDTFATHVWRLRDAQGDLMAEYTATSDAEQTFTADVPVTPESEGELIINSANNYIDSEDHFHLVGELLNNSNTALENIELSISLVDKDGKTLLKDSKGQPTETLTFSPLLNALGPGEYMPFDWNAYSIQDGMPEMWRVDIVGQTSVSSIQRASVAVENVEIFTDDSGNVQIIGNLVNKGDVPARINRFAGAALNDKTEVVGANAGSPYSWLLAPAGNEGGYDQTPFSVTMPGPIEDYAQWATYLDAEQELTETANVIISFVNGSNESVHLFWVAPTGEEQWYGTLVPSEPFVIYGLAAHVWRLRDAQGDLMAEYTATSDAEQTFSVNTPASLVEAFMIALKDKDYANIYQWFSADLQVEAGGDVPSVEQWANENAVFPLSWTPGEITITDGLAKLEVAVEWEDQTSIPMKLDLIFENGQWHIHVIEFINP